MQPKRASWSEDDTKRLLDLCLQEKEKLNFNQQGLTTTGWNNIYTYFPHYDKKIVQQQTRFPQKSLPDMER